MRSGAARAATGAGAAGAGDAVGGADGGWGSSRRVNTGSGKLLRSAGGCAA